jgi:hypothetical protein
MVLVVREVDRGVVAEVVRAVDIAAGPISTMIIAGLLDGEVRTTGERTRKKKLLLIHLCEQSLLRLRDMVQSMRRF